jgi:ribonuclease HI
LKGTNHVDEVEPMAIWKAIEFTKDIGFRSAIFESYNNKVIEDVNLVRIDRNVQRSMVMEI